MRRINAAKGKICLLKGSSTEVTRIKPFLIKDPISTIRIITHNIVSINNIFDDIEIMKRYKNVKIKLIIDKRENIENNILSFLNENYDVEIKQIDNVWTNLFIKESSDRINFDLYSFGYKTKPSYTGSHFSISDNRGISVKISNKKLVSFLIDWFDECWVNCQMRKIEPIHLEAKKSFKWTAQDGGGREFSNADIIIKNCDNISVPREAIEFNNVLKSDSASYYIPTHSYIYSNDEMTCLSYDNRISNNLQICFYSKELMNHINEINNSIGFGYKDGISENADYLFNRKEIHSEELEHFIRINKNNSVKLEKMKIYISLIDPINGARKFENTYKKIMTDNLYEVISDMDSFYGGA